MFAIQRLKPLRRLPVVVLIGLAVMALGGVLDVVIHLAPGAHHAHGSFASEHVAHLVGIAGMTLVLAGVVIHGVRTTHRRPRAANHGGSDSHAHR
jgi:hypothetical protein